MHINAARGQSRMSRNQKMLCRYAGRPVDGSSVLGENQRSTELKIAYNTCKDKKL